MNQLDMFKRQADYECLPVEKWECHHLKAWAKDNLYERELAFIQANAKEMENRSVPRIKEALENSPYIFTADRMLCFLDECDLGDDRDKWDEMEYEEAVDFAVDNYNWIEWADARGCTLYAPDYWEEESFNV